MKYNLINENFTSNYAVNLMRSRGIADLEQYKTPGREFLSSPTNLKNIAAGAAMYLRVVTNDKPPYSKVLIVVDSDNDGYTSAAIIYQYTKRLNCHCQVDYWLHEGKQHGLQDHIDKLMGTDRQYDLIILPDSSSNDAKYHDMLDEINIPCLILDHHLTDEKLSYNAIVVNNQLSPNYENKELTGAGVVYQFCRYVDSLYNRNWADDYLDLAAWGIIGDMGSVLDMENRYIIYKGLSKEYIKNDFLKCLLNKQAYSITGKQGASWNDIVEKTNPISIAFYIVPLVNAMIRMGTMPEKERLFMAFIDGSQMVPCNKRGAKGTFERVDIESARECTNAKSKQDKTKLEVVERLEAKIFKHDLLENKVLFVRLEDTDRFPSELNGLIAMQLAAKYKKPTIVARLNDQGFDRGSARGMNQSELKDFREFLLGSGMFEYAQGHANAFGISIPDDKLKEFHDYANEALAAIDFGENVYDVNFVRGADSKDLYDLVIDLASQNGIWGQNNSEPVVCVEDIIISPRDVRVMGSNQDTLKIEYNGMSYLKFRAKELIEHISKFPDKMKITVVGRCNLNEWGGRKTPQIFIDDCEINSI
jgi:single-stranded-DNA-specific exonuclease